LICIEPCSESDYLLGLLLVYLLVGYFIWAWNHEWHIQQNKRRIKQAVV